MAKFSPWDLLAYDTTTILLGSIAFLLYAIRSWSKPVSLAHPLLLGRQSDISRVRYPGETAAYRNYGAGHGAPLPPRPRKDVIAAHDLVQTDFFQERTLWSTKLTNEKLRLRINALAAGLLKNFELLPKESTVLMLLDDSFEWLLTDLALSTLSVPSISITKLGLLASTLEHHTPNIIVTHITFLDYVLEQISEEENAQATSVIVVGDSGHVGTEKGRVAGIKVLSFEEVEAGGQGAQIPALDKLQPTDVFTTSIHTTSDDAPLGTQLTHQNLTAGPTSIRQFFALTSPLSPSSTIISAFPLSSAFGRAIAYTALYEGSNFATLESTSLLKSLNEKAPPQPPLDEIVKLSASSTFPRPTHLFLTPTHLESLSSAIIAQSSSSTALPFLSGWAWSRKLNHLQEGFLSDMTIWDSLSGLSIARKTTLGWKISDPWLDAIVVAGGPVEESKLPTHRLALSVPIVIAHIDPRSTAPIFASHPYDLQHFPPASESEVAHVGPPGGNVEIKLVGKEEVDVDETTRDPRGQIFFRGPSIGQTIGVAAPENAAYGWVDGGRMGLVHSNGTFRVL